MTRDELSNTVDEIFSKIDEFQSRKVDCKLSIDDLVDGAISGAPELKQYVEVKNGLDFYESILAELFKRQKAARLAVWNFDLSEARAAREAAAAKLSQARTNLNRSIQDKANYLRENGRSAVVDEGTERLASLEVLITDYRAVSEVAQRNLNICKRTVADLEAGFNEVAAELGAPLIELPLDEMARAGYGRS